MSVLKRTTPREIRRRQRKREGGERMESIDQKTNQIQPISALSCDCRQGVRVGGGGGLRQSTPQKHPSSDICSSDICHSKKQNSESLSCECLSKSILHCYSISLWCHNLMRK